MDADQLIDFIENKMSMSHVYQPLVIKALVEADGVATVRQVAQELVAQDEPTLREAEKTIRKMPARVLSQHQVVELDGQILRLSVRQLTFEQKSRIRAACERRLGDYLERRGLAVWDYRLIDDTAVPYDVRYRVLAESDRRCALCGATEKERPLDVDHILPRSREGGNDPANLQVLCSRCNRAKGNRDTYDFRKRVPEHEDGCPFCMQEAMPAPVEETALAFVIPDQYPVTAGHALVVPRRHVSDFFSMTEEERREANDLLRVVRGRLIGEDPEIEGFTIGVNNGSAAGQTVMHTHIHLIPRREGDVADPFGGVRGVIPERRRYDLGANEGTA